MQYVVIVEQGENSLGAHVPDLPGCIAAGDSREEVLALIKEAINLHLADLRERGEAAPQPQSEAAVVDVSAA